MAMTVNEASRPQEGELLQGFMGKVSSSRTYTPCTRFQEPTSLPHEFKIAKKTSITVELVTFESQQRMDYDFPASTRCNRHANQLNKRSGPSVFVAVNCVN